MSKQTVAIVGASSDRSKFGNKAIRAYLKQGWEVYPVNPRGGVIEGLPAHASLASVPRPLDRVSLYVPPEVGLTLVPALAEARPRELFLNPGSESDELVAALQRAGLDPIVACSIVDIGESPARFPG
jgi:hypothetical protein